MGRPGIKKERIKTAISKGNIKSVPALSQPHRSPEQNYIGITVQEHRKRFGQFFTPLPVAQLMADWVTSNHPKRILDPAVGTGIFIRAIEKTGKVPQEIVCYDIDQHVLQHTFISASAKAAVKLINEDFLTATISQKYDGIIMNPPYLRHHDMVYDFDIHENISSIAGITLSRLANAYILFTLKACELLSAGGRAAFIVPTEWTNANFGMALKQYLIDKALLRKLCYFSHSSTVFEETLTTTSILFLEKNGHSPKEIDVHYVKGSMSSSHFASLAKLNKNFPARPLLSTKLRCARKWDYLIKNEPVSAFEGFVPLSELSFSKRGIATGANDFFHIPSCIAAKLGIDEKHLIPCVGRAADVKGAIFKQSDFDNLTVDAKRTHLINFSGSLNPSEKRYLKFGESQNINKRYLLSKRRPWYAMEQRQPASIWAAVFGRKKLRFIYNECSVFNLTTFHCIYPRFHTPQFAQALSAVLNSRIVQEHSKQHMRVYGGGLFKFEPKDLLDIEVPDLAAVSSSTIDRLASLLFKIDDSHRAGKDKRYLDELDEAVRDAAREAASKQTQFS